MAALRNYWYKQCMPVGGVLCLSGVNLDYVMGKKIFESVLSFFSFFPHTLQTGKLLNVVHRNPSLLHVMWISDTRLITASPESPGVITILNYW